MPFIPKNEHVFPQHLYFSMIEISWHWCDMPPRQLPESFVEAEGFLFGLCWYRFFFWGVIHWKYWLGFCNFWQSYKGMICAAFKEIFQFSFTAVNPYAVFYKFGFGKVHWGQIFLFCDKCMNYYVYFRIFFLHKVL